MEKIPSVLAIHDMSGLGRCALTVVMPALSAFGVQTVPVPTAVLSTHTGGYKNFAKHDLTDFMNKTLEHYKKLGVSFDAVYSGYLANENQVEIVKSFLEHFGKDKIKLVDPAFADDGKVYSTVTEELVLGMRELVSLADIITPNCTEAFLLLGLEPKSEVSKQEAVSLAKRLKSSDMIVIITGVPLPDKKIATVLVSNEGEYVVEGDRVSASYPGCGDLFASAFLGELLSEGNIEKSLKTACDLVSKSITEAEGEGNEVRFGLPFEKFLKKF